MSTADRRRLVSRARQNEESSPAQRHRRQRENEVGSHEPTPMPPYEPPACVLSSDAQRAIEGLRATNDYSKYRKHLKGAITALTVNTTESHDRLMKSKAAVGKNDARRQRNPDGGKPQDHVDLEVYTDGLEKKVSDLTTKAEKAMRQLVDCSDELAMQETILKGVSQNIAAARPAQAGPRRRRRSPSADGEEAEGEQPEVDNDAPAADENILSAVELLKNAKEEYKAQWASKSMRQRYGDDNDYKNFKRNLHDAHYPEENAPPVPHPSTWFPEDTGESAGARRRRKNTTNNTDNGSDDEEIEMIGVTVSLKCPLSLVTFTEPWTNNKCNHTFEKRAFEDFFRTSATVFPPSRIKQVKCPQSGCDKMLQLSDFYIDQLIVRKVQRAEKEAAREAVDDDDEDDLRPRGTQRNRPTQIEDDDDTVDIEERRKSIIRLKREKRGSHDTGLVRAATPDEDEDDPVAV